jgi:hypothetical protein
MKINIYTDNRKMSVLVPQEISMLVTSDPAQGAINRSANGSYFEIQLQDGLKIPAEALNINIAVENATIWWVIPNIKTGINDKIYITGPSGPSTESSVQLGFDDNTTCSLSGGALAFQRVSVDLPVGQIAVGDVITLTGGPHAGLALTVSAIISNTINIQSFTVTGNSGGAVQSGIATTFSRYRGNSGLVNYVCTIPQGLYDLSLLNSAVMRSLENQGALFDPDPILTFSADSATQRVELSFYYNNVSIDFTQPDTPRDILGFNSAVYGPYLTNPFSIVAPNIASFNQVNYFLIHSDLTYRGIRFNNSYNQTIAQVLIDKAPGSQIIYAPFNPARINASELAGGNRTNLRFWLTNEDDVRVDTNGEYWSARLVIRYNMVLHTNPPPPEYPAKVGSGMRMMNLL